MLQQFRPSVRPSILMCLSQSRIPSNSYSVTCLSLAHERNMLESPKLTKRQHVSKTRQSRHEVKKSKVKVTRPNNAEKKNILTSERKPQELHTLSYISAQIPKGKVGVIDQTGRRRLCRDFR